MQSGPKHPAARRLVDSRFFHDLESFSELETRISALPLERRGDAFEVFAEAYLATQTILGAKAVWPFDQTPPGILAKYSLNTARDMGVDGVYQTNLGDLNAYQAKFRSGRPPLRWDELSTFMGLSDRVSERVLFTNSNDLPDLMEVRRAFFCIRGADLDRLERADLAEIAAWLDSGTFVHVHKIPRDYQREAVEAISDALAANDRTTAVLACGTGKTLIGLWAAERLAKSSVLVLEPSLALIRQSLHTWVKETSWDHCAFLCVCSDPTVAGDDSVIVRQSDLDFPVTTDPRQVQAFLRSRKVDKRVVFSTYQSASVVGEALHTGFQFDIGLFDEAHKTAGREGSRFTFALRDEHLPIRKRVFMTATPRHYDVTRKNKEGDAQLVYSMDVPEAYGSRAYTLSFRKAADRNIICDYRVLISVVTDLMVNDELLRRGEVVVQGDVVKARQVANQIALRKATEEFAIKRIFSFHRSVEAAKSFVASGGEGIGSHLPGFSAYHVNGTMRTSDRDKHIKEFRAVERGIMTNARCLTEGVDVPAVDMVAFMSPKRSKVDIVQAVGRAMRQAPNKDVGYVLVPLYLEQAEGEPIAEALERSDFGEVWHVLGAMQEQDGELVETIREMRTERGSGKGYDDSRFREHVTILGPEISLSALRESITVACIDRLGVTWDERFGQLIAYKERHGDCNVPKCWRENPALGTWVGEQRKYYGAGRLSDGRVARLDTLGFTWDAFHGAWEKMLGALDAYRERHGHCNVPQGWSENPALGAWATKQRLDYRTGQLAQYRIARLEKLGFTWNPLDTRREKMFSALTAYKEKHGDCNVPFDWPENPALGTWVSRQRRVYRDGRLSQDRIARLEGLGFDWTPPADATWEQMFAALAAYKERHQHCDVPGRSPENPTLATWVGDQRKAYRAGRMSQDRIARLQTLGFRLNPRDTTWERMLAELAAYKERYGDCHVPTAWPENPSLGKWAGHQRQHYRFRRLSQDRIACLEALGFPWN